MGQPHWGREQDIARVADEIVATAQAGLVEIVAESTAGSGRFLSAVSERLVAAGINVFETSADTLSPFRPGSIAETFADSKDLEGRTALLISDAQLADATSLGVLARRLVDDPSTTIVLDRSPLADAAQRPFTGLARIAQRVGSHRHIALEPPTVENIARSLGIDQAAAQALHRAATGSDADLIEILEELGAAHSDAPVVALDSLLVIVAERAAPLGGLDDVDHQIVELVAVSLSPLPSSVLASITNRPERQILDAVDRLSSNGLVSDTSNGVSRPPEPTATSLRRALTASRSTAANQALATALSGTGILNRVEVGCYYEGAGDWQGAFSQFVAASESATEPDVRDAAVDRALRCLENGATTDAMTRGRLLLSRGRGLRNSAFSDLALADLEEATSLLTGHERIDALGFLASVLDDQQRPQHADVSIAVGKWESHLQGAPQKLGSLMALRARTAARLGFAAEADDILDRGVELIRRHGTRRQQDNAKNNRAWIAFDRGRATTAEQLFDELRDAEADATTSLDASALACQGAGDARLGE